MFEPAVTQLTKRSPKFLILEDARSEEGVERVFGVRNYPASVFYSHASWVGSNPDVAKKLTRAMQNTLQWMHQHSPEEIMAKMPDTMRGDDPAIYLEALKHSMPMYSQDGRITAEGAAAVKSVLSQSIEKVRNANIRIEATFTNQFLAEVR